MSLSGRIGKMLGKAPASDANLDADRARQQSLHGQGMNQTAQEQAGMRERMEAELDGQRSKRTQDAKPEA